MNDKSSEWLSPASVSGLIVDSGMPFNMLSLLVLLLSLHLKIKIISLKIYYQYQFKPSQILSGWKETYTFKAGNGLVGTGSLLCRFFRS